MAMASLATLLVSAGVAASTTVVIEFVAKPSLDARRERILERRRARRELIKRFTVLTTRIQDGDRRIGGTRDDWLDVLLQDVQSVADERRLLAEFFPRELAKLLDSQIGYAQGLLNGGRIIRGDGYADTVVLPSGLTVREALSRMVSEAENSFVLPLQYLRTSSWRLVSKRRLVVSARRTVAEENARSERLLRDLNTETRRNQRPRPEES
jgi:hypothetical protein